MQLACFLVTAWEAFAKWEEKTIWECPVEFTNVSVYQPVQVERTAKVALNVIFDFSQNFQACLADLTQVVCACLPACLCACVLSGLLECWLACLH